MDKKVNVLNESEMKGLATEVASQVKAGDVLLLKGDLGAGKTTFTKYFAAALGVEGIVSSPTFTVIAEYVVKNNENIKELIHADLYRFEKVDEIALLSLQEMWGEAQSAGRVVVIEWPERLGSEIPSHAWHLEFKHGDAEEERKVTINR